MAGAVVPMEKGSPRSIGDQRVAGFRADAESANSHSQSVGLQTHRTPQFQIKSSTPCLPVLHRSVILWNDCEAGRSADDGAEDMLSTLMEAIGVLSSKSEKGS